MIYAKRDLVMEQLQGMADRDEKRRWVGEYWAELLGVSAPVFRPSPPRGPRVLPRAMKAAHPTLRDSLYVHI